MLPLCCDLVLNNLYSHNETRRVRVNAVPQWKTIFIYFSSRRLGSIYCIILSELVNHGNILQNIIEQACASMTNIILQCSLPRKQEKDNCLLVLGPRVQPGQVILSNKEMSKPIFSKMVLLSLVFVSWYDTNTESKFDLKGKCEHTLAINTNVYASQ